MMGESGVQTCHCLHLCPRCQLGLPYQDDRTQRGWDAVSKVDSVLLDARTLPWSEPAIAA